MDARAKGVAWLLRHVGSDGGPEGAELSNGWSRLAWALAITGEVAAASTTIEWTLRAGIDAAGGYRPARGSGLVGAYLLGQVATGAVHLERLDVAARVLDKLESIQSADGGLPIELPGRKLGHITDLCSTAQVGLAALLGDREAMAEGAYRWVIDTLALQKDLQTASTPAGQAAS